MNFPAALHKCWRAKRYRSFNGVLKDTFGARVYKIGLRLDFTCPNRDGRVAVGGCTYCNNASHTPGDYRPRASVSEQLEGGADAIFRRHRAEKYIAYFQSFSNTYDSPERLEKLYREALAFPGVVGLSISTRPDCLPDDVLDLLEAISRETYLWLEIGLESMNERTLRWINRGHGLREYVDAVERCKKRSLRLCTHLIFGFPDDSHEQIVQTAALMNRLNVDGVKLHNLHVIKHTALEKFYRDGHFAIFSEHQYVALVVDFLERLNPATVVHRLTGETYRAITVAPEWSINKIGVHNAIQRELEARDTWQGRLYSERAIAPHEINPVHSVGAPT
jgi:radical SAM protein (TIGR01212 family)